MSVPDISASPLYQCQFLISVSVPDISASSWYQCKYLISVSVPDMSTSSWYQCQYLISDIFLCKRSSLFMIVLWKKLCVSVFQYLISVQALISVPVPDIRARTWYMSQYLISVYVLDISVSNGYPITSGSIQLRRLRTKPGITLREPSWARTSRSSPKAIDNRLPRMHSHQDQTLKPVVRPNQTCGLSLYI